MGKLGSRLQVHPASVTSAVKRLEFDGLVRRVTHPKDNRSTLAVITADGRRLLVPATAALNQVFEDLGPEPADLNDLVRILNGIRAEAGDRVEASARESRV
jgi:DNA-binding MarR family transcriptional regulator